MTVLSNQILYAVYGGVENHIWFDDKGQALVFDNEPSASACAKALDVEGEPHIEIVPVRLMVAGVSREVELTAPAPSTLFELPKREEPG